MVPSNRKKVKNNKSIRLQGKTPTTPKQNTNHLTLCWKVGEFDWDGNWGAAAFGCRDIRTFLEETIKNWESMTWEEIYSGAGGRAKGNNSHPVSVANLSTSAKKRLIEIIMEDIDELVSLRVSSTERIYGIRDSRALKLLWYDPWHDDRTRAVYPVRKK